MVANIIDRNNEADPLGLLDGMLVQDALLLVVVYAAQIDSDNSESQIKQIATIAENCPVCVENAKGTLTRIYRIVNALQLIEPEKAMVMAVETLNPELRKTAFEFAADVLSSLEVLPDRKRTVLDELAGTLSINEPYAV